MADQAFTTTKVSGGEAPSFRGGADQAVPARERALKQWRGDQASDEARADQGRAPHPVEPEAPPAADQQVPGKEKSRSGLFRQHPFGAAVGLGLLLAVGAGGYVYYDAASHFETTDDAFIGARQFSIAPKVSGYIIAVPVTDNQHVKAGDVIARIDDRDYRIALAQAEAQVKAAQAAIRNIDAQSEVQQAQITAGQAQVEQAQAGLTFAEQQAQRYQELARMGSGTVQNEQQYSSQLRQQRAALTSAQANLQVAQRQLESLKAQRESADANLAQAEAQRDQAKLNLSYTAVTAAQAGRVVNLGAADGQFVSQGTALTMFVPDDVWVAANFKETQLDHMRSGQPVTLQIDAYPEREIRGHVASVQPGSGTAFSLLPAQNATGNYVKIVQRVPVKIVMDNPPADVALGPGMSVVPTVRVDPKPSLYERLRAML
ncbi:HlyD family secretion protein [Bradyrhizobium sp. SZCCHNS2005]|uniref:HlyD family secretion protein n=1 Tax=Bradyrhizobium sp. SZCCHNS2005 TaxID=3057303 RepID=UPI0028E5555E|nr:HlyD family secretion protein [Bradyrhizobium sp. SZCCHNS2005]